MKSITLEQPEQLWSLLVEVAQARRSGLIAAGAPEGMLCRIREGRVVGVEGEIAPDAWAQHLVVVSALPAATVERAVAMSRVARVTPARLIAELGLAGEQDLARWTTTAQFGAIVLGEGPWEWRELAIDDEPNGVHVLDALARTLTGADTVRIGQWGAPLNDLVFSGEGEDLTEIDRGAAAWLVGLAEPRQLKEVLRQPLETPRLTLAWLAIARNAGWLRPARTGGAAEAETLETMPAVPATETEEVLEEIVEVEPLAGADADGEDFVELDANLEIAEVDELLDAELLSDDVPEHVGESEAGPAVIAELEPVPDESEVPAVETVPEPEPEPRPAPVRKRFYEVDVPADIHKRLGVPPGAAGQGVLQAYSKRYRRVQKLLEEQPGDPRLEAWRRGLLHAYRILNNGEALAWYERVRARGDEPDPAGYVACEMVQRAREKGIALLRGGDLIEAGRALHEALSWDDTDAQAWLALGLQQAAHEDDPDEIADAYRSFTRAVACAPDDPHAHYYRCVAAHFAGEQDAFDEERAWLDAHADRAPEAWSRFREQAA